MEKDAKVAVKRWIFELYQSQFICGMRALTDHQEKRPFPKVKLPQKPTAC